MIVIDNKKDIKSLKEGTVFIFKTTLMVIKDGKAENFKAKIRIKN